MTREYVIQGHYGPTGWEDLTAAEDSVEAVNLLLDYNVNEPGIPHRITTKDF